jgi:hypothetical protein
MKRAKAVYLAGTRQNEGKTTLALGLLGELVRRGLKVGFIKPVGQQYVDVEGVRVDKDSLLLTRIFSVDAELGDTSPVAVDRLFTRNYIDNPQPERLRKSIREAYERVARGKHVVVIEGTGHAGVGAVIDLSNAQVAKLLGAPVIIVSSGGIGRPVDEFILNRAVFEKEGVPILGVVVNKILPDKIEMIRDYLVKSLTYHGLKLLGVMPEMKQLSRLTIRQLARDIGARVTVGEQHLDNLVDHFIIGAMTSHKVLDYLTPGALMITGGDRDDLVLAAIGTCFANPSPEKAIAGLILTGGMAPDAALQGLLIHAGFPVLLHEGDSFTVATMVNNLVAKIQVQDTAKHRVAIDLVRKHVDIDGLLAML